MPLLRWLVADADRRAALVADLHRLARLLADPMAAQAPMTQGVA